MESLFRFDDESPGLWSFPFTLLLVVLVIAAADVLFAFLPFRIGHSTWMWAFSALITSVIASLVAEKLSMDRRKAIVSMVLAGFFSILFYRDLSSLFQRTPVESIQSAIPNPFISMAVYTSALTIIPGVLVGGILGSVIGSLPLDSKGERRISFDFSKDRTNETPGAYEMICPSCGRNVPFEAIHCPFCGKEPARRTIPHMNYCWFCGAHMQYRGNFCPECGRDITLVSKPLIFYAG